MPEFMPEETKTATIKMKNPTTKAWDYAAELYLGKAKAAASGLIPFSIPAKSSRDVSFSITMPSIEGTYIPYIDVFTNSRLIAAYQAIEDVVITPLPTTVTVHLIPPKPLVEPLYGVSYTWDMYLCDKNGENLISHRDFGAVPSGQPVIFDIPAGFKFPARLNYPGHNFYLWEQPAFFPAPQLIKVQDTATIPTYGEYNYYPDLGNFLGEFIEISEPQPILTRPLTIAFKNMPEGATRFLFGIIDSNLRYGANVDSDMRQDSTGGRAPIGAPMTFNIPFDILPHWEFPLKFSLGLWYAEEYYHAQSRDESKPDYVPAFIPGYGSYYYNIATERFERI